MNGELTIKDVITKMICQNNRCTRLPIYYQIEDEEELPTAEEYSDGWHWYFDDDTYDSDEAKDLIKEDNPSLFDECESDEEVIEDYGFTKVFYLKRKVYKGMFLTEESAENHLKSNRYHYGENARTYVFHAWRNKELEDFFQAIANMVGLGEELKKRT